MNRVPESELVLVPGGTLITATPEEGRLLAITLARHSVHNVQPDLDVLVAGRPGYSTSPDRSQRDTLTRPPRTSVCGGGPWPRRPSRD